MSELLNRIESDLKAAMRRREESLTGVLRLLKSALYNRAIELRRKDAPLSDEEVVEVVRTEIKKRREAAGLYRQGGRPELAEREENEAAVMGRYAPAGLSEEELGAVVRQAMAETGAQTPADLGRLMGAVMPRVKGRADGAAVRALIVKILSST